jgi:hypothetical protein
MSKGVVIIAAGNAHYGGLALNLAMGLKQTDATTNITLLWQGQGKDFVQHYPIFDNYIEIPKECTTRNGIESLIRAKVCLYDLSPYEETIYIDADVVWCPYKPISQVFEQLKDVEITIGNRGECNLKTDPRLIWSNLDSMRKVLGEDAVIYNLSSEFIYFKKSENNKLFFEEAKSVFDFPDVDYVRFDGGVPDELAFQIAMIKTGVKPHKLPYLPFYWESFEKRNLQLSELYKEDFYGYSIGGNMLSTQQKMNYDTLAKVYASNFGITHPFLSFNKRDLFTNRKQI